MYKKSLMIIAAVAMCFAVSSSALATCQSSSGIVGFCYVQGTYERLVGVEVTVVDEQTGETYRTETMDIWGNALDGIYRVQFRCELRTAGSFTVYSEETFVGDDGAAYTRLTDQFEGITLTCGQWALLINFEYELRTAVLLDDFEAVPGSGSVALRWVTSDETDNFGFNIYRFEEGNLIKVNDDIVYAGGAAGIGSEYELIDEDVDNRKEYTYYLEDVDVFGARSLNGPVKATPRLIYGIGK